MSSGSARAAARVGQLRCTTQMDDGNADVMTTTHSVKLVVGGLELSGDDGFLRNTSKGAHPPQLQWIYFENKKKRVYPLVALDVGRKSFFA